MRSFGLLLKGHRAMCEQWSPTSTSTSRRRSCPKTTVSYVLLCLLGLRRQRKIHRSLRFSGSLIIFIIIIVGATQRGGGGIVIAVIVVVVIKER